MRDHLRRRLELLDRDIGSIRSRLAMAREGLSVRTTALEESRLRMLIAETPVADHDLHRAAHDVGLLEARIRRLEADLEAVRRERARLTQLQPARSGS